MGTLRYEKICESCGGAWIAQRVDARFCSKPCRNRSKTASRCQNHPDRPARASDLCSTCYNDANYGSHRHRFPATKCPTCEQDFHARRKDQRFCSLLCRSGGEFVTTPTEAQRKGWREARRRRRARLREIEVEDFADLEIYERDGWRCQLCRKKVNKDLRWPHPKSATIDHIIPLTEVGTSHTRRNVRLAHLLCNTIRSNRGGNEQLALIG